LFQKHKRKVVFFNKFWIIPIFSLIHQSQNVNQQCQLKTCKYTILVPTLSQNVLQVASLMYCWRVKLSCGLLKLLVNIILYRYIGITWPSKWFCLDLCKVCWLADFVKWGWLKVLIWDLVFLHKQSWRKCTINKYVHVCQYCNIRAIINCYTLPPKSGSCYSRASSANKHILEHCIG
jgi:hypothetical protein